MSDRDLLEMAAKAAGIGWDRDLEVWCPGGDSGHVRGDWNPLTDDGDALRLAVKLGLLVYVFNIPGFTAIRLPGEHIGGKYDVIEIHLYDACAATRRAIVRAAAEI